MKTKLLCAALTGMLLPLWAAPLTESTFTEIVRDVNVVDAATKNTAPAQTNILLKAPDRVRTGAGSRAELTAADKTITRVGANTVFSFADSGRTLNLEQGNILFHAPKGLGGGTIKSGGAVAAVLGTTLIVSATPDGGFKVILLEGKGIVTLANGKSTTLKAGQMVFVPPAGTVFSSVMDINLGKLVAGSLLVNGFSQPLPSAPLIREAILRQNDLLASGDAIDTGKSGLDSVDHGSYLTAAPAPISKEEYNTLVNIAVVGGAGPGGRNFSTLNFKP